MYWTRYSSGSLHRAGMDGSNSRTLATGLVGPRGMTIDVTSERFYGTERNSFTISSINLDGQGLRSLVQLPTGSNPYGMAVYGDRIYWGKAGDKKLQSSTKDGKDVQTLYTDAQDIHHLVIVPSVEQPANRVNHCVGRNCSKLCVLTPTSYRCLA